MPASTTPTVKLNNGYDCPVLGLGTWKSKPGEVTQAVKDAIDVGYRHIDCAYIYGNETEVGAALKAKFDDGTIRREDIFITSKLWNTFHRPELVLPALKTTLKNLGLQYLDLYLIHWPMGFKEGDEMFPVDGSGNAADSGADYVDTWEEMEKAVKQGLTKSIGVSNFNPHQVDRILASCEIKPAVNQIECHPYLIQKKWIEYLKTKDIKVTGYSPLGSFDRPWAKPGDPQLLEDPKLKEIADKYNKTPAQVLLRYQIELGNITIPKSINKSRMQQNMDIFDFKLSPEDIGYIETWECNGRVCAMNTSKTHQHYSFQY